MRKRAVILATVVLSGTAWVGASAATATVCASKSCSTAIDNWNAARICDGDSDGNAVETNFYRDNGSHQTVLESRGNGNCSGSGSDASNRVYRHQAHQLRDWAPDLWSSFEYRY